MAERTHNAILDATAHAEGNINLAAMGREFRCDNSGNVMQDGPFISGGDGNLHLAAANDPQSLILGDANNNPVYICHQVSPCP
ncbi:hypothetical protein FHU30_004600 [Actinomadura rupiterrae]|nr:hypothetical protein [Actinomadura rupiterrae]